MDNVVAVIVANYSPRRAAPGLGRKNPSASQLFFGSLPLQKAIPFPAIDANEHILMPSNPLMISIGIAPASTVVLVFRSRHDSSVPQSRS